MLIVRYADFRIVCNKKFIKYNMNKIKLFTKKTFI